MTTEATTVPGDLRATESESGGLSVGDPMSDAQRRAQKRKATMQAQSYATGFRLNDIVRTITPRSPRFHGRRGQVVTTNLGEVGVAFTRGDRVDAWFLPAELTRVTA